MRNTNYVFNIYYISCFIFAALALTVAPSDILKSVIN